MNSPFEVPRETGFPALLNRYGCKIGAEVGVCRGEFSRHILSQWPGTLWMIDAWEPIEGYPEPQDHQANWDAAALVAYHHGGASLIPGLSLDIASRTDNESLDFIYIDADHRYEAVLADLSAWYPKLKPGGIFAGDDYGPNPIQMVDFGKGLFEFGIKKAVDEFALEVRRNISLDLTTNWGEVGVWQARNWWWIK